MIRHPAVLRALRRPPLTRLCVQRRAFSLRSQKRSHGRALEGLNPQQLAEQRRDYERTRMTFLMAGTVAGLISIAYTGWKLKEALDNPKRLDSVLPPTDPLVAGGDGKRKVVIHDKEGGEIVPTGNSVVPYFPRTIELPTYAEPAAPAPATTATTPATTSPAGAADRTTEYTLVGLGLRTVSFLSIQVYVVGYYIATPDIAALQSRLVKKVNPIATTLVSGEKDELRSALLDPEEGEETWETLLQENVPARSLFRVVPVRDTDFHHLRDGFVRAIQARSAKLVPDFGGGAAVPAEADLAMTPQPPDFGESMREFRQIFNRGKVPKQKELLLLRDGQGRLTVVYDDGRSSGRQFLGTVSDERVSRALWLNYLAGKKVASEPARQSIVEGVMEFVERPVGTVATQVI